LPAGASFLFAGEDLVGTPLGRIEIDAELRSTLKKQLEGEEDRWADNTVEVLLPMVKYFFPETKLLWARFPAEISSFKAGKILADAAAALGRNVKVLASTDLTHYGPGYGFTSHGSGKKALEWMKNINDRRFIDAVLDGDAEIVLLRAEKECSACSPGAVLGAMGFTGALDGHVDVPVATLLEYSTSAAVSLAEDGIMPDSFVGYAAICFGNAG
jgi:AmmeMemoRadiSam system protein B